MSCDAQQAIVSAAPTARAIVVRKPARFRHVARALSEDTPKQIRVCKLLRGLISIEVREVCSACGDERPRLQPKSNGST
jgi:hypothetical protein